MPQLNPEFFLSQLFWLVITFSFLLIFLWKISLPRIDSALKRREKINDRMEDNSKLFFDNVRAGYRQLAIQNSNDYFLVDGMLDVNNLHNIIWSKINKVINI